MYPRNCGYHQISLVRIYTSSPALAAINLHSVFRTIARVNLVLKRLVAPDYHSRRHTPQKKGVLPDIPRHKFLHGKIEDQPPVTLFRQNDVLHAQKVFPL